MPHAVEPIGIDSRCPLGLVEDKRKTPVHVRRTEPEGKRRSVIRRVQSVAPGLAIVFDADHQKTMGSQCLGKPWVVGRAAAGSMTEYHHGQSLVWIRNLAGRRIHGYVPRSEQIRVMFFVRARLRRIPKTDQPGALRIVGGQLHIGKPHRILATKLF